MKSATEITATAIYKIKDQPCWYVPSDSQPGKMYKVCCHQESWSCGCKHGQIRREHGQSANCKHVRACEASIKAHRVEVVQFAKDSERTHYLNFELGMGI